MKVHIEVASYDNEGNARDPWIVAGLFIDGELVAEGHAPNSGAYKKENIAESSAISRALANFTRQLAAEANTNIRRWRDVPTLAALGRKQHVVQRPRRSNEDPRPGDASA